MRKILIGLGILVLLFVGLVYISLSSTEKVFKTCEIIGLGDIETLDFAAYDSVLVAASTLYESGPIKDLIQGEQYREAWATPLKVPIVFLDTLMGGMRVIDEGGGKQTHSLKLKAKDGRIFSLRSINKDPEALIPDFAKKLGLENIIVDGISAQHPYAAIVVSRLAEKAQVLHTEPKVVFIPEQETLGRYNQKYGNRLFLLEHETEGGTNWIPLANVTEIIDTEDLQELRKKYGKAVTVDKHALVRARLFDILIGDWDRHAKQWGWVVQKTDTLYSAIPLPGDRDNAFFQIGGILPSIISNKHLLPGLQSFDKDIDYLPGLVMPFDVYFLKNTPKSVFISEAKLLQKLLTDQAIEDAFEVWPEAIYRIDGKEIISNIKKRRDNLIDHAEGFSKVLADKSLLTEPLKGSEDAEPSEIVVECFDCD